MNAYNWEELCSCGFNNIARNRGVGIVRPRLEESISRADKTRGEKTMKERKIEALRAGMKFGVYWFAVWRNGKQWVGSPEKLLKDVLNKINKGGYDKKLLEWEI